MNLVPRNATLAEALYRDIEKMSTYKKYMEISFIIIQ